MLWNRDAAPTLYMAVKEPNGYGGKGDVKETQWSVWPTWESWNWPGWEGRTIDVEVCSKAPAVRLYLNGRLVGEKPTTFATEFKAVFPVAYAAGQLRAVAVDAAGRETDSVLLASIVVRSRQKRGSATISVASSLDTHAITLPVR